MESATKGRWNLFVHRLAAVVLGALVHWTGRGRPSRPGHLFVILVATACLSNLGASVATFTASSLRPGSVHELNSLVRPGSIVSLGDTELLVVLCAALILFVAKEDSNRTVLQSMVTGLFLADALHDTILFLTQNPYAKSLRQSSSASVPGGFSPHILCNQRDRKASPPRGHRSSPIGLGAALGAESRESPI